MSSPFQIFQEGGPFMFPLLCMLPLFGMVGLIRLLLAGRRRFFGLGLASLSLVMALGVFASLQGMTLAFEAVAHASPDMKGALMAHGLEAAMLTTWTGLVVAVLAGFPHLLALLREGLPPLKGSTVVMAVLSVMVLLPLLVGAGALVMLNGEFTGFVEGGDPTSAEQAMEMARRISGLLTLGKVAAGLAVAGALFQGFVATVVGAVWGRKAAKSE